MLPQFKKSRYTSIYAVLYRYKSDYRIIIYHIWDNSMWWACSTFANKDSALKKDIIIPEVKNVYVAAIQREDEQGNKNWWVHIINDTEGPLEHLMIQSRGYSDLETKGGKQTATLRKAIKVLPAKSAAKLEPIMPEVFDLFNEYWISFFEDGQMKDRKYIFGPHTIDANFMDPIPVLQVQGILVR